MRSIDPRDIFRLDGGNLELLRPIASKFVHFRPRSELVRRAQVELLLRHTRFQTILAPFLGVFLVLAFADTTRSGLAWAWLGVLGIAYGARIVALLGAGPDIDRRLIIYLTGLGAAGFLWALAPFAIAPEGTDAQLIAGIFVSIVVLIGIVGNFLYYQSAVLYLVSWIIPSLVLLGIVYTTKFEALSWTYAGVVVLFLIYAYKCLEVINLPMAETLELNEAFVRENDLAGASDCAKSDSLR